MSQERERNIEEFNRDVDARQGYVYSTSERLSCRLANQRMTEAILELAEVAGKRVIDIGCGDGIYTLDLVRAGAREVLGVDAAERAVESARERGRGIAGLRFEAVDIYALEIPDEPYDVAVVRGILHHLYDAPRAVERICRVARRVVVVEPNGYNPVLKIIEKVSPYHRQHEEKSYRPSALDRWHQAAGGEVERSVYIGLVPMFCPAPMARILKILEPVVEKIPFVRAISCGQYVQRVRIADR